MGDMAPDEVGVAQFPVIRLCPGMAWPMRSGWVNRAPTGGEVYLVAGIGGRGKPAV